MFFEGWLLNISCVKFGYFVIGLIVECFDFEIIWLVLYSEICVFVFGV